MDRFTRRSALLSDASFNQAVSSETQAPIEGAEGFSCPGAEYACNNRCRSIGYKGGYCGSWLNLQCRCY